jgi:hypothetical protein
VLSAASLTSLVLSRCFASCLFCSDPLRLAHTHLVTPCFATFQSVLAALAQAELTTQGRQQSPGQCSHLAGNLAHNCLPLVGGNTSQRLKCQPSSKIRAQLAQQLVDAASTAQLMHALSASAAAALCSWLTPYSPVTVQVLVFWVLLEPALQLSKVGGVKLAIPTSQLPIGTDI